MSEQELRELEAKRVELWRQTRETNDFAEKDKLYKERQRLALRIKSLKEGDAS